MHDKDVDIAVNTRIETNDVSDDNGGGGGGNGSTSGGSVQQSHFALQPKLKTAFLMKEVF